jgi:hypothetical protein
MIPEVFIENWRKNVPWQMSEQIEQDLIISRALVDLYNDPHIKDALVFRGGTALNKLFILRQGTVKISILSKKMLTQLDKRLMLSGRY